VSDHGWNRYDQRARTYNPATGLFDQLDPMAHLFPHISGYAAFNNNPFNNIDPDGRIVIALPIIWGIKAVIAAKATTVVATTVATTAVVTTGYAAAQEIKNSNITVSDVGNYALSYITTGGNQAKAIADFAAKKHPREGYGYQQGQDKRAQKEARVRDLNMQKSINNNIGQPSSDGSQPPKRDPKDINKIVKTGLVVAAVAVGLLQTCGDGDLQKKQEQMQQQQRQQQQQQEQKRQQEQETQDINLWQLRGQRKRSTYEREGFIEN